VKFNRSISKIVAGVLLIVFTISVTPKKYFHDILSHHQDELFTPSNAATGGLNHYQFSCGFVDIAIVVPFLPAFGYYSEHYETAHPYRGTYTIKRVWGDAVLQKSLRGPPSA
jgi:hypothetical protein